MAMIAAGFTGGEAEELRRAMGFKRSEKRMADIEVKLRAGMTRNGITGEAQETIVHSITSFALYGFPESHAASFALLAYASAYLKCHYLAAFTCAHAEQSADGILFARDPDQGCAAARPARAAGGRAAIRIGSARSTARSMPSAPGPALCQRPARGGRPRHRARARAVHQRRRSGPPRPANCARTR